MACRIALKTILKLEKKFKTQKALAEYLGVTPRAIRYWKAGTYKPSPEKIVKIRAAKKIRKADIPKIPAPVISDFTETQQITYFFEEPNSIDKAKSSIPRLIEINPDCPSMFGRLMYFIEVEEEEQEEGEEGIEQMAAFQTNIWGTGEGDWINVILELRELAKKYEIEVAGVEIVFRKIK